MLKTPSLIPMIQWAGDPSKWDGRIEGADLGANVTVLFYTTDEIGAGPKLHVHDYDEMFIVRKGRALFTVGDRKIEAGVGDVLFAPARIPHKFHNMGPGRLETTDIHLSDRFVQVLLDDPEVDAAQ